MLQDVVPFIGHRPPTARTSIVDHTSSTTAPHGLTGPEIDRLASACHFMEKSSGAPLWFASMVRGSSRRLIRELGTWITALQRQARLPCYRATVIEVSGGQH